MESCFGGGKKSQMSQINFMMTIQEIAKPLLSDPPPLEGIGEASFYFKGAANFSTSSSVICWSQRIINLSITFLNSRIFPVQFIF